MGVASLTVLGPRGKKPQIATELGAGRASYKAELRTLVRCRRFRGLCLVHNSLMMRTGLPHNEKNALKPVSSCNFPLSCAAWVFSAQRAPRSLIAASSTFPSALA